MELKEIKKDLFTMSQEYFLAHCISADAKMGAGIAVQFKKRYKLASLQEKAQKNELEVGKCYRVGQVMNLVTKAKYWHKPTYDSLAQSVQSMKEICLEEGVKHLAMPEIGCGLDRLQWGKVKEIVVETFKDTDIDIVVCRL